jgi:putative tryptophan/tyrosine transport system substrate-binding protein
MRRREFIAGLGGAAAWPLAVQAQQPGLPLIGFLSFWAVPDPTDSRLLEFHHGLAETGYFVGQNVAIEYREANGQPALLPALASQLVRRKVAVIVATQFLAPVRAAKAATSTIPIVFVYGGDPVQDGLVSSLNKPGGNVTGAAFISSRLGGKRLDLLHEFVPQATTVALLLSGDPRLYENQKNQILEHARALELQVIVLEIRGSSDYEAAFATLAERKAQALIVGANIFSDLDKLVGLSERYKIPTIYSNREYVMAGGLMSYGTNFSGLWRRVGNYTGQILKGAQPAGLPVTLSTKFDLVINLKAAKALGLELPLILRVQADEVIE